MNNGELVQHAARTGFGLPARYRDIVRKATAAATALGIPSSFSLGLDAAAVGGVWTIMLKAMTEESGRQIDKHVLGKLVGAILAGCGGYLIAIRVGSALFNLVPGAGTAASIAINSGLNAVLTYRLGHTYAAMLEKGDFEIADIAKGARVFLRAFIRLPSMAERRDFSDLVQGN